MTIQERNAGIRARRARGELLREIAAHYGLSMSYVANICAGEGRLAAIRAHGQETRDANRVRGLCACGAPPLNGHKSCLPCLTRVRDWWHDNGERVNARRRKTS